MPNRNGLALLVFALAVVWFGAPVGASSPLCIAACVKAEVRGIPELAEALKEWSRLLPQLNEQFHEKVQDDLDKANAVAESVIQELDRTYGKNLDLTDKVVRSLIDHSVEKINEIGQNALLNYKKALFETDCQTVSVATIIKNNIKEVVPTFMWIRSFFGEEFNVFRTTDFAGNSIEETFDPDSNTERFSAAYNLLTRKLASAVDTTPMVKILDVALERNKLAYSYHCETRASIGSLEDFGHIYNYLQTARLEYREYYAVASFGKR